MWVKLSDKDTGDLYYHILVHKVLVCISSFKKSIMLQIEQLK